MTRKNDHREIQGSAAQASITPTAEQVDRAAFPIVGIGASAGGLEAFGQLLQHLPADTGMAFVLIQHLDPVHVSQLAPSCPRIRPSRSRKSTTPRSCSPTALTSSRPTKP